MIRLRQRRSLGRPRSSAPPRSARHAGRPNRWATTGLLVLGTLAVAVTGYSLSQSVAGERRQIERLAAQNRALAAANRSLEAELRVRMRLPQLQSWNDGILGMMPITAEQHVASPVHLARYAMAPAPAAAVPAVPTLAILSREGPEPVRVRLVSAPAPAAAPAAAMSSGAPAVRREAPLPGSLAPRLAEAAEPAAPASLYLPPPLPADLLRLVEAGDPQRLP